MAKKVRFMNDRQLYDLGNELRKNVTASEKIMSSPSSGEKNIAKGQIEGVEQAVDSMFLSGVLGVDDYDFLKLYIKGHYDDAESFL